MIQNLGMLQMFEREASEGASDYLKQFRHADNFGGQAINSLIVSRHIMPGFAFKRKSDGRLADSLLIKDLSDNTIASINLEQLDIYSVSGYEYYVFRPKHGYNFNNLDGNNFLDDVGSDIYTQWKPFTVPCGTYFYKLVLKIGDVSELDYYSEVFEVRDIDVVTNGINLLPNANFHFGFSGWTTAGTWDALDDAAANSANSGGSVLKHTIAGLIESDLKKYRIKFTVSDYIGTDGLEIRVYDDISDSSLIQSLRVNDNGTYIFYADRINEFEVIATGVTSFIIGVISIEEIVGYDGYTYIASQNECRGVNALDVPYADFSLFDAEILQPEYGEELRQDENGNLEKVNSFARAFKTYDVEPLLLPEFMIDFLASLNTFDDVIIYDGKNKKKFELNSTSDETDAIAISGFKLKNSWQEPDTYGLINLAFEQNLAIKNTCCDQIEQCPCDDEFHPLLKQPTAVTDGYVHLQYSEVAYPCGSFVELFVASSDSALDCDGDIGYVTTGIVMSAENFNANGIYYPIEDDLNYCFYLHFYSPSCPYKYDSNTVSVSCIPVTFEIQAVFGTDEADGHLTVTPTAPVPSGYTASLWVYGSPPGAPGDCDTVTPYAQSGSSISSDAFNSDGFIYGLNEVVVQICLFVRLTSACGDDNDSNKVNYTP